jgi:large subunit ribosomal protein L31
MKAKIHPKWYEDAKVVCACGNTFTVGASIPEIRVEVCSNCHPFYTGQMKYVDTAGRVDAFKAKRAKAKKKVISKAEKRKIKKEKRIQKELSRPDTLEELRKKVKKTKSNKSKKSNKRAKN